MIGFIGIGGAGGNIADEAARLNYPTLAINFSEKDLDSLEHVELKLKLLGSEGVGHNRELAISLIQQHWETAVNFIKEHFSNPSIEVIFISFSTGGGSGSGSSPILIEILSEMMPDKIFVAVPIIPDLTEVTVNQMNSIKTFEELSSLNVCILPLDNNKAKEKTNSIGKGRLYQKVNSEFINKLHNLYSYTHKTSKNGNFDKRDFITLFSTKGIGLISETELNKCSGGSLELSTQSVSNLIHQSWNQSPFANIEFDQVMRFAVIFDAQESLLDFLDYKSIFSPFKNGMPLDLFEGIYHEQKGKLVTAITGLSWSTTRLNTIEDIINQNQEKVESMLVNSTNQNYQSSVTSIFDKLKPKQPKKSVSDILSKYKR